MNTMWQVVLTVVYNNRTKGVNTMWQVTTERYKVKWQYAF